VKSAKQMLDHMAGFAKHIFDSTSDHEVIPMWVVESETEVVPILAPFSGDDEKNASIAFVREKAKSMNANVVGFMCEAWVVEKIGADIDEAEKIIPSEHDDRREIIQIHAEDRDGNVAIGSYYILRPEHGTPKLSPFRLYDDDMKIGGRFTSILEKVKH